MVELELVARTALHMEAVQVPWVGEQVPAMLVLVPVG